MQTEVSSCSSSSSNRPARTRIAGPDAVQLRLEVVWHLAGTECRPLAPSQVLAIGISPIQAVDAERTTVGRMKAGRVVSN